MGLVAQGQERDLLKAFTKYVHFCWQTEAANVNRGQREVSVFTGPASSSGGGGGGGNQPPVICNCKFFFFFKRFCGPDMKLNMQQHLIWTLICLKNKQTLTTVLIYPFCSVTSAVNSKLSALEIINY